jgi:hypothetical protein
MILETVANREKPRQKLCAKAFFNCDQNVTVSVA